MEYSPGIQFIYRGGLPLIATQARLIAIDGPKKEGG